MGNVDCHSVLFVPMSVSAPTILGHPRSIVSLSGWKCSPIHLSSSHFDDVRGDRVGTSRSGSCGSLHLLVSLWRFPLAPIQHRAYWKLTWTAAAMLTLGATSALGSDAQRPHSMPANAEVLPRSFHQTDRDVVVAAVDSTVASPLPWYRIERQARIWHSLTDPRPRDGAGDIKQCEGEASSLQRSPRSPASTLP